MKVLFIGGVFDETMEKEILKKSKGTVHYAANKFQWNLIDGLLQLDNLELEILSAPLVGAFPRDYKDIQIRHYKSTYKGVVDCNYVEFNNIWGFRNISRKYNLIKDIKNFVTEKAESKTIIVYSAHTPFLQAAVHAKKHDPSIHICLVIPDLPQFMNLNDNRSITYDVFKKIDIDLFEKNSEFVDSYVLLTEPMKEMLNVENRPYVVIEGIINIDNCKNEEPSDCFKSTDRMTVVYTGTLNKKFGVVSLVEAFHNSNIKNTHLKICGRGDSENIIKSYADKDERIVFLGQLSNKDAIKLQKQATILVNPRQNNEEFTKYSFPSKNMEYLLTGRPVIAYKLDGIPSDYDKYLYYVNDDTIESLTSKIEEVLLMDEESRINFGARARAYVMKEKNNISASKRIIEMIQECRRR